MKQDKNKKPITQSNFINKNKNKSKKLKKLNHKNNKNNKKNEGLKSKKQEIGPKKPPAFDFFNYETGGLLESPNSIALCGSVDCLMDVGLPKEIDEKFKLKNQIAKKKPLIGDIAFVTRGSRFIIFLIVKNKSWHDIEYEDFEQALRALAQHCQEYSISSLSIPPLGGGGQGLDWPTVAETVRNIFEKEAPNVKITVHRISQEELEQRALEEEQTSSNKRCISKQMRSKMKHNENKHRHWEQKVKRRLEAGKSPIPQKKRRQK